MEKIDYGDINKFLVSVGIVLIGLSIVTPYLYLKEDFGLYIELEKFQKFQEPVKDLIVSKQVQVSEIQKLIPYISLGLFLTGLLSFVIGLVRWIKRQSKLDEKFDKELHKLELEIVALSPEEKEKKAIQEVQEIEKVEQPVLATQTITTLPSQHEYVRKYMVIEKSISDIFQNYNSPYFLVLSQQRIGHKFEIDILLKSISKKYLDRIIEIKYFQNNLPNQIIRDIINKLNTQISYYSDASNRRVIPVLMIVYNKEKISAENILRFQNKIVDESINIPNLERLKVEFIDETEILKFDVGRIIKK